MASHSSQPWLEVFQPSPHAAFRLFCFPYAGGGAAIYRLWARKLPAFVEVCPVELPGRGRRFGEPPFSNLDDILSAAAQALIPEMDRPFAFFGHSFGALIAYEMTRFLRRQNGPQPEMLFLSGHRAPQYLKGRSQAISKLPDADFLKEMARLGGTPPEVLAHQELIQLFLPTLRADLNILETYTYHAEEPLTVPLIVLGGLQDAEVGPQDLEGWRDLTQSHFSRHHFPGDHFFLKNSGEELLKILSREIEEWNKKP